MKNSLESKINQTLDNIFQEISQCKTTTELEIIKKKYVGKDGIFYLLTEELKQAPLEERRTVGSTLQLAKEQAKEIIIQKDLAILLQERNFPEANTFDPMRTKKEPLFYRQQQGTVHAYTHAEEKIANFFGLNGFDVVSGPILEDDYFNFTALNIPESHPARDTSDTFWISNTKLLRTHTSSVQIRRGKEKELPFGIVSFGRVYRNEATDATHDFMFYQLEGMLLSKSASIATLIDTLKKFFNYFFNSSDLPVRVRPGYFPFVEPGMEIDFQCPFCQKGCSVCKKTRWIELGGMGMIHPNVINNITNEKNINGWAFGMGITRMIMLKERINDIRLLHNALPENL